MMTVRVTRSITFISDVCWCPAVRGKPGGWQKPVGSSLASEPESLLQCSE